MKIRRYIFTVLLLAAGVSAQAQLDALGAQFYQNQYLGNPAMAGANGGLHLNAGYSRQWSSILGSPSAQFITLDGRTNKVGFGLNLYNDKAGLFGRTRVVGTYAYHLPLNEVGDQLHFGISLGVLSEHLSTEDINGEPLDVAAQRFNERNAVLDGDFGMAYTTGKLTVQGAVPNLKNFLKKEQYNTANWNTFFTAISYRFGIDSAKSGIMIEPKVVYRGVRGYDDIIDAGVNLSFASNKLYVTSVYHSTESISFGLGINYKALGILTMYTSGTSAIKGYSSGNFEIALGYNFSKK